MENIIFVRFVLPDGARVNTTFIASESTGKLYDFIRHVCDLGPGFLLYTGVSKAVPKRGPIRKHIPGSSTIFVSGTGRSTTLPTL